jgi:hypothetical protein
MQITSAMLVMRSGLDAGEHLAADVAKDWRFGLVFCLMAAVVIDFRPAVLALN